ncbi:helix-turn-helix domain-containing protein [Gallibacterium anatis]|uniref:helix-turn-helix domain-containing protein n=1 Tax=Gallibacterium anatis TaxID=750 RepID=UPI00068B1594
MQLDERYFSISDLVKKGIGSKSTIQRFIKTGKLKSYKFGCSVLIAESDLLEFMKPNQNAARQTTP